MKQKKGCRRLLDAFVIVMLLSTTAFAEGKCGKYNSLPPGYELEKNQFGEYRPIDTDGIPLFWITGPGTYCAAIERAWSQYLYDKEQSAKQWKKTKAR